MSDGLDYLMRPLLKGMYKWESLFDGTVDLCAIDIMNEALDVDQANQALAAEAVRAAAERK